MGDNCTNWPLSSSKVLNLSVNIEWMVGGANTLVSLSFQWPIHLGVSHLHAKIVSKKKQSKVLTKVVHTRRCRDGRISA